MASLRSDAIPPSFARVALPLICVVTGHKATCQRNENIYFLISKPIFISYCYWTNGRHIFISSRTYKRFNHILAAQITQSCENKSMPDILSRLCGIDMVHLS